VSTLSIDGAELYYQERGAGPPLLLIHGTQPDADCWGAACDLLAENQRVIVYDRRGFSRSSPAPDSDYRRDAADAAALLRGLAAAPATVLGWSWGGLVALALAARHPDLVAGLVLVEPSVHLKKHLTLEVLRVVAKVQVLRRLKGEVPVAASPAPEGGAWTCCRSCGPGALARRPYPRASAPWP
jgi:pimeloyl-ACP methyl ester carboxylesterase